MACAASAFAQATPDAAKAWVKKAAEFYQAHGKDKALAEFSDPKGQFFKGDLYIFVLDLNGKMLAHPKAELCGKDFLAVKDARGKLFAAEIVKEAKEKGNGWIEYKCENPATKVAEDKITYFERVGDMIIAAGYYDQSC
jgi:signal transduction histidine kinase